MTLRRSGLAGALAATVLTFTWVSAPAAPTAPPPAVSSEMAAAILDLAPVAEAVAQEAERLRARLQVAPNPSVPTRDPFSFGRPVREAKPSPPDAPPVVDAPVAAAVTPQPPAIVWPTLAAVMTEASNTRTAVLALGDAIEFLAAGATWRDFVVVSLDNSSAELRHIPTNTLSTLRLR